MKRSAYLIKINQNQKKSRHNLLAQVNVRRTLSIKIYETIYAYHIRLINIDNFKKRYINLYFLIAQTCNLKKTCILKKLHLWRVCKNLQRYFFLRFFFTNVRAARSKDIEGGGRTPPSLKNHTKRTSHFVLSYHMIKSNKNWN